MDLKELYQEDMDKVAGGVHTNKWLNTVEEIEQLPIFEELKQKLAAYKRGNDLSNPQAMKGCEDRLIGLIKRDGGYRVKRELVQEFVQKYLPLV